MTDLHSTPADRTAVLGWDFNQNASLEALAAWEEYRQIPINPGTFQTERDAFTSGFDAATKATTRNDRTADALEALVTINKTAARIAYTTRPGYAPGPAVREWIETELGL